MEEKNKIKNSIYYPLLASEEVNGGAQSREEFRVLWERFDEIDFDKKEILSSQEMAGKLFELQERYSLKDSELEAMSVFIRWYYFGQETLEEWRVAVGDILENYPEALKKEVVAFIENSIFTIKPPQKEIANEQEVEEIITKVRLQILQALSQFPNLGNQNISSERIKIKSQPEPARGSLYNWIKYYRDELGIGQHSTVERGQFLFRSENGKKLTSAERERVNLILKSLEENLPLEIDSEHQEIIFPEVQTTNGMPSPSQSTAIDDGMTPVSPIANITLEEKKTEFLPVQEVRLEAKPFISKPPLAKMEPDAIAKKFEPSQSPYEKIAIPQQKPLSLESLPNMNIDVSQVAEKLKREPKPEWIKGAFTKESIPETTPIAPVAGSMTFSFNHALPAEQEAPQVVTVVTEQDNQWQAKALTKKVPVKAQTGSSQFHIRPASRGDL
jgi:hypothetical protein